MLILRLFIGREQIIQGATRQQSLFLVPMSIARPQLLEGAIQQMEGGIHMQKGDPALIQIYSDSMWDAFCLKPFHNTPERNPFLL